MPIPEDRLYKPIRVNRWFAVSSVLMTASLVWLIWVDYDRPWRGFQDSFFLGQAALAHLDYLDANREERRQEIEEARRRLADARQLAAETTAVKRAQLETERVEADLKFRQWDGPWSRLRQVLDVTKDTYERTLEEKGSQHSETVAARNELRGQEEELEQLRKEKERWEDRAKELQRQIRELDAPLRQAEKRLADLEQVAQAALDRDQDFRGVLSDEGLLGGLPIVKAVINMPLLDFTAPKNTPGRHQVNQLVLPDVRQRLNYLESYTTDRCTTCHVAIDDPAFSKDNLARKLERSLPGINEQLVRMDMSPFEPPAPPVIHGREEQPLPAGRVTEFWDDLSEQQQNEYFEALLAQVNHYLKVSGRKTIELDQPLLAHPDLELYVTVDSPHPMARVGCTVCHEGNPQETDFVQAAHSPPTHEIEKEWKEKYYISMLGVPNVTFKTIEHYWDRAMRLPEYTEAGCTKCHSAVTDIGRFQGEHVGSRINMGEHLFREVGCINCHNVEDLAGSRRVGPDLTYVAAKLKPEFVQPWVWSPKSFRPSTLMPHFFMQENNREQSANNFDPQPVVRTETEVAAITKYLFAVSRPYTPIAKQAGVTGDKDRGRELFKNTGCLACHSNLAEFGEEWITKDLAHRENLDTETAGHRYKGMTHEQRVRYAMEHFVDNRDTVFDPERARFEGGSHYTTPVFSRFAPELSGIGSKVTAEWLYSWLIEPTHYAPDTKMPSLRLTPEEAADITAYLMDQKHGSLEPKTFAMTDTRKQMADQMIFELLSAQRSEARSRAVMNDEGDELTQMLVSSLAKSLGQQESYDLIRAMSLDDKKLTFLGNKMVLHYGCYACHKIAGFEDTTPPGTDLTPWAEKPITQLDFAFYTHAFHHMREERDEVFGYVYPRDAKELNYWSPTPDDTREQITHTHHAFAKHKMLNPRIWDRNKLKRPYDKLKMPNFFFTEREAEALTTYLLSRIPPRVNDSLKVKYEGTTKGPIAEGRALTRELNCIACHEIEDNAPTIQQYFRRKIGGELRFDNINAPPSLRGEGAKIQHRWLHKFLHQVETLRPWLNVRMPTFNLTSDQATTLVAYFAALSQDDSATLTEALAPIHEYQAAEAVAAKAAGRGSEPAGEERAESEAGADWYERENLRPATEELSRFALERHLLRPAELDQLTASPEQLKSAHDKMLTRVEFLRSLYGVEFPFVEPPTPMATPDRLSHGLSFVNAMGCLKCHVLGPMLPGPARNTDEFVQVYRLDGVRGEGEQATVILNGRSYPIGAEIDGHKVISAQNVVYENGDVETKAVVEGPSSQGEKQRIMLQAASAPNLALTYERLRRTWVFNWMLEPQWIQPGTKMPQNFGGGKSPFEGDPNYPGTGLDHIDLLVDTLYDAGRSNLRVPLAKNEVKAPSQEEFDESGGAEEFEE